MNTMKYLAMANPAVVNRGFPWIVVDDKGKLISVHKTQKSAEKAAEIYNSPAYKW